MAVIPASKISSVGRTNPVASTLTSSDTFVYTQGVTKWLHLRNGTAGALTPTITGSLAVSEYLPGVGVIPTASGYAVGSIAAGVTAIIDLDAVQSYLKGVITITGGVGLSATLMSV
jgi:hypothetical protein